MNNLQGDAVLCDLRWTERQVFDHEQRGHKHDTSEDVVIGTQGGSGRHIAGT